MIATGQRAQNVQGDEASTVTWLNSTSDAPMTSRFHASKRSLPWHAIFATQLRAGTASPEIVAAAERSRREWEAVRDRVPTMAP